MTVVSVNSLDVITDRIKAHLERGNAIMREAAILATAEFIEAGKQLLLAKAQIPHGKWRDWLQSNFSLKSSSAKNLMSIAERFSNRQSIGVFGNFNYTQLVQLLPLPPSEVEDFLASMTAKGTPAESMSVRNLREAVRQWRQPAQVVTIEAGDASTAVTSPIVENTALPVKAVQLRLFDDAPTPMTPPLFLIPRDIQAAAAEIDTPVYLVLRAVKVEIPVPAILVALATPYAYWVQRLEEKCTAFITSKISFTSTDGRLKKKATVILYFGDDVDAFSSAFKIFGAAVVPYKRKSSDAANARALS